MPLVSPAYTVGGINRKSFSQLNGKLRTKEKTGMKGVTKFGIKMFPDLFLNLRIAASL